MSEKRSFPGNVAHFSGISNVGPSDNKPPARSKKKGPNIGPFLSLKTAFLSPTYPFLALHPPRQGEEPPDGQVFSACRLSRAR